MDRDRLKEVHQTDLTESRVNEDFVDWLKNKGPTWLLVVMIAVCAYLAVVRLEAAHQLVRAVQRGVARGAGTADPTSPLPPPTEPLSVEQREQYLTRADGLYTAVVDTDTGGLDLTLLVVNAINGKAAVAECRRDTETARSWYKLAADRAEPYYAGLAEQARARAESAGSLQPAFEFPTTEELARRQGAQQRPTPVTIDEGLRQLILPDETDG